MEPIARAAADCAAGLRRIIDKLLCKKPDARFADGSQLYAALVREERTLEHMAIVSRGSIAAFVTQAARDQGIRDVAVVDTAGIVRAAAEPSRVDGLLLKALGSNGVFDAATGARMPEATEVAVRVPGALRMGRFRLVATRAALPDLPHDNGRTMIFTAPLGHSTTVMTDWSEPAPAIPTVTGSLLKAFCQGAGLDASLLSSEPPRGLCGGRARSIGRWFWASAT